LTSFADLKDLACAAFAHCPEEGLRSCLAQVKMCKMAASLQDATDAAARERLNQVRVALLCEGFPRNSCCSFRRLQQI